MKWEIPGLVDLVDRKVARGAGCLSTGGNPDTPNCGVGNSDVFGCHTGNSATYGCYDGNAPKFCYGGSAPG